MAAADRHQTRRLLRERAEREQGEEARVSPRGRVGAEEAGRRHGGRHSKQPLPRDGRRGEAIGSRAASNSPRRADVVVERESHARSASRGQLTLCLRRGIPEKRRAKTGSGSRRLARSSLRFSVGRLERDGDLWIRRGRARNARRRRPQRLRARLLRLRLRGHRRGSRPRLLLRRRPTGPRRTLRRRRPGLFLQQNRRPLRRHPPTRNKTRRPPGLEAPPPRAGHRRRLRRQYRRRARVHRRHRSSHRRRPRPRLLRKGRPRHAQGPRTKPPPRGPGPLHPYRRPPRPLRKG
mmetsp:Transcript_12895/g.42105  ORF Transcript_12895/g.42105 Transcript_12895/m.42105 type:complete len:292 (-) Transcript_12895:104-979(-)